MKEEEKISDTSPGQSSKYVPGKKTPTTDITPSQEDTTPGNKDEKFFTLVNTIEGVVWEADPFTFSYTYVSQYAEKLLGYPLEQWTGDPDFWVNHLHPDDRSRALEFCTRSVNKKKTHHLEYRMISAGGSEVWMQDFVTVIIKDETVVQLRGIMVDITERKKAEVRLLGEQQLLQTLINNLPLSVYIKDRDGKYLVNNLLNANLLGVPESEIAGKTVFDFFPDDIAKAYTADDRSVINSGQPIVNREEQYYVRGKTGFFSTTKVPLYNDHGFISGLVGISTDITEQKRIAEELAAKEKYFRKLIENSSSAIILFDEEANFIYQSPVTEKIAGYKIEDTRNSNLHSFIHPEEKEKFKAVLGLLIASPGITITEEFRFLHHDGHYIWLEATITNRLHDNEVKALIANYHNISDRKKAEEEIKAERSLLRAIIDNIPDPIYVKDIRGKKIIANRADLHFISSAPGNDAVIETSAYSIDQEVMLSGMPLINREETVKAIDGAEHCLLTSKVPLRNTNGELTGLLVIGRDITQNKIAEEALLKSNERFEFAGRATFDAIWDWDIITNNVYRSEGFEKLFGYDLKKLNGYIGEWNDLVHPDDKERTYNNFVQLVDDPAALNWADEYRYLKANGEYAHVQDKALIIRNKKGKAVRMIGAMQDITIQRQHEQRLIDTEKRFRSMVENGLDGVVILSTEGNPIYVSPSIEKILGYREEEAMKLNLFALTHPGDLPEIIKVLEKSIKNPGTPIKGYTSRTLHKDGSWRLLENITSSMLHVPAINGIIVNFRDVTEKLSIEKKIIAEKELSESIINNLPGIFYLYDDTGKFIRWNKNFEKISGYSAEEIQQMHPLDFYDAEEKNRIIERITNVFKHRKVPGIEASFLTKDNKNIPFFFNSISIVFEGMPCIIGMGIDITERKNAEEQLRISEQQLNLIYNNVTDVIFLMEIVDSRRFRFVSVNNTFLERMGLKMEQVIGKYIEEILPQSMLPLILSKFNEAIQSKKTLTWEEISTSASGRKTGIVTLTPILNNEGECIRFIGSVHDITESKQTKEALLKSNERFEYVSKATFDAIWDWDRVSGDLYWGENFGILFGHPSDNSQINDIIWNSNVHPDDFKRVAKTLKDIIDGTENNWSDEYRFKKGNGEYAYVQDKGIVIRNEFGEGIRMIGAMQDITRRKREEQQLKLLESAITNTLDSVLITEVNAVAGVRATIVYVNDAFCRMTGYTKEEVLGRSPEFLRGPKTDIKEIEILQKALETMQPCVLEIINYKKNGEEFWVNFEAVPVTDHQGKYTHWLSIQRDTTARRKLEGEKEILYDVIKAINNNDYVENGLVEVLEKISNYLDFKYGEVWLLNFDKTSMVYKLNWQAIDQSAVLKKMNQAGELKKGIGLAGKVMDIKASIYLEDLQQQDYVDRQEAEVAGLKSALAIPIFFNGEVVAVFIFYAEKTCNSNQVNAGLLQQVSNQLGAVIQKNRTEEELNRFFNLSPDMLCIAGIDGYLKKINPAFTKILGYSEQVLLSTPLNHFLHPGDKFIIDPKRNMISKGHNSNHFVNRFIAKSGEIKWLEWTVTSVPEEGLLFAVTKDITEKRKMDEERKRILESISDCFYSLDKNFNYIYINKAAEEMLQVQADELIGKNIWKEYPVLLDDNFQQKVNEAISTKQPVHFEYYDELLKSWFEESVYPTDEGLSIFFRSINERKATLAALVDAYEEKTTILESVTDGFYTLDKNWEVTYWNKMAEEIIGIEREDIVGQNIWEIFDENFKQSFYTRYQTAMHQNVSIHFEDFFATINSWLEISAYPSPLGLSVYFKNVTERKEVQQKLNLVNEELAKKAIALAESNSELERFAYVASHDLQEPLRMVNGFLKLLEKNYKDQLDEVANKYIHFAVDGAERMKRLIMDLLEYSRITTGSYETEDTDMNEVVREVKGILTDTIEDLNAAVVVDDLPILRNTHKTQLFQLMQNLLGNALKYHRDVAPVIKISAVEKQQEWQFSIADNGIGIDPEFKEKVFVIFQRLHNNDKYSGTGIGLSICKKIVEKHGGRIWAESIPGKGSTFYFTIKKAI